MLQEHLIVLQNYIKTSNVLEFTPITGKTSK
jgi:hypothetical protein